MVSVVFFLQLAYTCSALVTSDLRQEHLGRKGASDPWRFEIVQMSSEEMAKHLSEPELMSINQDKATPGKCTLDEKCCLGAASGGADNAWRSDFCLASDGVRYNERFQLTTPSGPGKMNELFEALDVAPASITWVGDSVFNQVWNSAQCALSRKPGTYNVSITATGTKHITTADTMYGWAVGAQTSSTADASNKADSTAAMGLQFVSGMSAHSGGRTVAMEFFRAYQPLTISNATFKDIDSSALGRACKNSDMLISNFGLHWNRDRDKAYEDDMGRFLDYLLYCVNRGGRLKTLIWVETTPQHFVGPDGDYFAVQNDFTNRHTYTEEEMTQFARDRGMTLEELKDTDIHFNASTMKCWPHRHIHGESHAISWRHAVFQKLLHDRGIGSDGAAVGSTTLAAHILPTHDFMSDLSYMHPGDCTHWCYTPLTYEPIWHRLHHIFGTL